MKRMLAMLLTLVLLVPVAAFAEEPLVYERQAKKFIDFPTMDGWRGHFSSVTKWTIVTPETLDENWELVASRGDPEEEIRARYAQPTFLFEAYSPDLPRTPASVRRFLKRIIPGISGIFVTGTLLNARKSATS